MINNLKAIVDILALVGIPSIFVMISWCIKKINFHMKQMKILSQAQKAQMRGQMLRDYYDFKTRGFLYSDELDEWINQYEAYHILVGPNGVLDSRKDELLKMPTQVR